MNVSYLPLMANGYSIKRALKCGMKLPKIEMLDVVGNDENVQDISKLVETTNTLKLEDLTFVLSNDISCKELNMKNCSCSLENLYNHCKQIKNIVFNNCKFFENEFEFLAKFAEFGCVFTFQNISIDTEMLEYAKSIGFLGNTKTLYINTQLCNI